MLPAGGHQICPVADMRSARHDLTVPCRLRGRGSLPGLADGERDGKEYSRNRRLATQATILWHREIQGPEG